MILDKGRSAAICTGVLLVVLAQGCTAKTPSAAPAGAAARVNVAASISTLAALVKTVGGDNVDVTSIVPVGVSAETYDPAPQDLVKISKAQVIFENGAGLELWLAKVLRSAANPQAPVIVLSLGLPVAGATTPGGPGNPHLWLDPRYAQDYVRKIAAALRQVDPTDAQTFSVNEKVELQRLVQLDSWISAQIATIPPEQRNMITFHDAWYYFDRRYGIRDIGAIELSPGQEPSAKYLSSLIDLARANHVRAVFAEPQFSPKLAQQLATSAGIKTVSNLYDDTLGTTPELQTYEGMLRYDVRNIVGALKS